MNFNEYAESIRNVEVPKSLEFGEIYGMLWLDFWEPSDLISLGGCSMKIIKVPRHVEYIREMGWGKVRISVTGISETAFAGNENVTDIILPSGLCHIPAGAFAGCKSLKNIVIPKSVTKIHAGTFEGCANLESIYYEGTLDDWKKVEVVHHRHEIEFGDLIPGTPVSQIVTERMEYIPGNEAVFTANVHFRCEHDEEELDPFPIKSDGKYDPEIRNSKIYGFRGEQPDDEILDAVKKILIDN